jgi:hypothetical protein
VLTGIPLPLVSMEVLLLTASRPKAETGTLDLASFGIGSRSNGRMEGAF